MISPVLVWLVRCDPTCPPELLRAAWSGASTSKDGVALQAAVARHPNVPADLDQLIGARQTTQVRLAQLRRPGLSAERGLELLAGETRLSVLSGLTTVSAPAWAADHVIATFTAQPTWALAKLIFGMENLAEPTKDLLVEQLVPQLAECARHWLETAQTMLRYVQVASTATSITSRSALVIALTPLVLNSQVRPDLIEGLLTEQLTDEALTVFGTAVLQAALTSMQSAKRPMDELLWRRLIEPLLGPLALPAPVLALRQEVLEHPKARKLAVRIPLMHNGHRASDYVRTTEDLDVLKAAADSSQFADRVDALHNVNLTARQVRSVILALGHDLNAATAVQFQHVPMFVRLSLRSARPEVFLTAFGWDWTGDPDASQWAFIAAQVRKAGQAPATAQDWRRLVIYLLQLHEKAPFGAPAWLTLPASVLGFLTRGGAYGLRDEKETSPFASAVGAEVARALGGNAIGLETFFSLLVGFTGTIGELISVSALLSSNAP